MLPISPMMEKIVISKFSLLILLHKLLSFLSKSSMLYPKFLISQLNLLFELRILVPAMTSSLEVIFFTYLYFLISYTVLDIEAGSLDDGSLPNFFESFSKVAVFEEICLFPYKVSF